MSAEGNIAFIGIGANKGDRQASCGRAIEAFKRWRQGKIIKVSSFYETEPWGYENQNLFINCVVKITTSCDAYRLLSFLQQTEKALGKQMDFFWGPRTLDLDLLFFNAEIIKDPHLKIPHPLLYKRRFVLEPMVELDPNWTHPVLKKSVQVLLRELKDNKKVMKITGGFC